MEELLTTKFFIPKIQPNHIKRPELIERLKNGLQRKLTLVSAPAGFGKSMLVSEWIDNIKTDEYITAWISLEKTENDSALFLSYLVGTLMKSQGISSTLGNSILNVIEAPKAPLREVMIALLNEIAESSCKIILVIDDLHIIDSLQVHETLKFLIDHLPPCLHFVILTRDDPPLPLARFRANNQMNELRASELRFTSSHIISFFNSIDGLKLSPEDIDILEDRTEGWIVGMQLAALSLKGRADIIDLNKSFAGNNRYILDYLITEVLDRQTDKIRDFLLQTSILNQFTGELCDFLTGQNNSFEILDYLVKTNLFIVPLDDQGHWYRYHHLFADLLRMNLSKNNKKEIKTLRLKASNWFEANNYPEEAIEYSLIAEDYQKAVQLLTLNVDDIMIKGKYLTVWHWLIEIPENYILPVPELCLVQAWKYFTGGNSLKAEEYLQSVENFLEQKEGKEKSSAEIENVKDIKGRMKAIMAFLDSFKGDVPSMIINTREALSLLSPRDLTWRSLVSMALGDAYGMTGELQKAFEIRLKALEESKNSGNIYLILLCSMKLAITYRMKGELSKVIDLCYKYHQFAEDKKMSHLDVVGWLFSVWGETLAETGQLEEALIKVKRGGELTESSEDILMTIWSQICLSRILFIKGDLKGADEIISVMEELMSERRIPPYISNTVSALRGRLLLVRNKINSAIQWSELRHLSLEGNVTQLNEAEYMVFARIFLAQKQYNETNTLLQQLLDAAENAGRISKIIEILILQALTLHAENDVEQSSTILKRVLILAEKKGFFSTLLLEGPQFARLLYESSIKESPSPYVNRLLLSFKEKGARSVIPAGSIETKSPLIEQLSEREMDVLRLLAEGLSRQEMSDKLFVSLHTVKTHLRNIYSKLGIHNRLQAINMAQSLGILEIRVNSS
jgi:LuxR family transcriptional regulator, maltose regulon positive regulatory protein